MTTTEARPPGRPALLENERLLVSNTLRLDRGQLALLKRNVGNSLGEARGCFWFYDTVPYRLRAHQAEPCFLVATLMASATRWLRRQQVDSDETQPPSEAGQKWSRSFGAAMARLKRERANGSGTEESPVDRRFSVLLDAYLEKQADGTLGGDLAFRLRQMVRMADASDVSIDWAQLLWDVRHWNDPGKPVQKRWARDYYDPRSQSADAPGEDAGVMNTPDPEDGEPDVD